MLSHGKCSHSCAPASYNLLSSCCGAMSCEGSVRLVTARAKDMRIFSRDLAPRTKAAPCQVLLSILGPEIPLSASSIGDSFQTFQHAFGLHQYDNFWKARATQNKLSCLNFACLHSAKSLSTKLLWWHGEHQVSAKLSRFAKLWWSWSPRELGH